MIFEYIKDCKVSDYPSKEDCEVILYKISKDILPQTIFDYGTETIDCLRKYYEEQEDYEQCAKIRDSLKEFNNVVE